MLMLFTINLCTCPRKIIYKCTLPREMFFPVYKNQILSIEFHPWDLIQRTGKEDFPCPQKWELLALEVVPRLLREQA